ncbi:MAG: prokaryotic E2 ligase family D protein [Tannerellaceae bacterium]|jgi:PRTRC genetic system protein B|nr:prokaryotic E2 ligase family D protein [Tannerellaceae bacterium]
MGNVNDILTNRMTPEMAVIVYRNREFTPSDEKYYLERRPIESGRMGAGVPLTEDCLSGIVEAVASNRKDIAYGKVPPCMLYADPRPGKEKYVWYRKPEARRLFFAGDLGIPDGPMRVPGLVYMVRGKTLSLYAFKGSRPKKQLFRAPLFNVGADSVCLGNAKAPKPDKLTYDAIICYWEKLFWQSEFTHIINGNPVKGNLSSITRNCIETGCSFPLDELIPVKTKLENLF